MDHKRKRVRVHRDADGTTVSEWTFHEDQRLVGVCAEPGVTTRFSLVAAGERHVQIRDTDTSAAVGKLVALESGRSVLRRPQDGVARFYVALPRDGAAEMASCSVCVLDAVKKDTEDIPFPAQDHAIAGLKGEIESAFVDEATGNTILMLERCNTGDTGERWLLWCWRRRLAATAGEWTTHTVLITTRPHSQCVWDARFFTSPVFGQCLHLVGIVSGPEEPQVTMESRLFAVDDDWRLFHSHQKRVTRPNEPPSSSPVQMWLSVSSHWVVLVEGRGRQLVCVPLDPFEDDTEFSVSTNSIKCFEVAVVDIAWHDDCFAVLLADGSVYVFGLPRARDQPILTLDIVEGESTTTSLSLVALQKASMMVNTPWHRLLWIPTQQWLLASCGVKTVRISLSVEDSIASNVHTTTVPVVIETLPSREIKNYPGNSLRVRRRRLHSRRDLEAENLLSRDPTDLPVSSMTNITEIIHSVRAILVAGDALAMDAAFTLLGILLQRILRRIGLLRKEQSANLEDAPIQVGIMEMLVAQVLTAKYLDILETASRIVHAPAFRTRRQRQSYYHHDAHWTASARSSVLTNCRLFIGCVMEILPGVIAQVASTDGVNLRLLAQSAQPFSSIEAASEVAQSLKEMERQVATSGKCDPWRRLRAVIAVFTIGSDLCGISRPVLDVATLLDVISLSRRKGQVTLPEEKFLERFVTTAPNVQLQTEHPGRGGRSHVVDIVRGLAVKSGVVAPFVDYCGATNDAKVLELLHSTLRRQEDEPTSQQFCLDVMRQTIAQLESFLRFSPLLTSLQKVDNTSGSWITIVDEADTAMDAYVKLVFVTTDAAPLSDIIIERYIQSSSTTHVFGANEIHMRTQVFKLSWVVMHHLRQSALAFYGADWSERLPYLFSDVFLFEQLWAVNTTEPKADHPTRDVLQFLNEAVFDSTRRGTIQGRVTGLRLNGERKLPALPPSANLRRSLRTFAVVLWSLWIRDRASFCKEAIGQYRSSDRYASERQHSTSRKLGSMAASCAVHLKALALFRDKTEDDEMMSTQLFFLEAAAELNASVTSNVVTWAFSSRTMNTRHLRRFRGIQAIVGLPSGDEGGGHVDQFSNELRRAVQQTAEVGIYAPTCSNTTLDVFGTCCCDSDFQRVVWALQQRRFSVVSTTPSLEEKVQIRKAVQARQSSVEGLISRHDVVNLLQAQRHDIEDQMQRLRRASPVNTARTTTIAMPEGEPVRIKTENSNSGDGDSSPTSAVAPKPSMASARVFDVRDLNARHRSHEQLSIKSDANTGPQNSNAALRKGSSTQNVLKLLQLRKAFTNEVKRHRSSPQMVRVPIKPLGGMTKVAQPPNEVTGASKERCPRQYREPERVLPLRRDHPEAAELLLLTAPGEKASKSVPLSRRSFRLAIPSDKSPIVKQELCPPEYSSCAVQCTEMRTTSMQTEAIASAEPTLLQDLPPERLSTLVPSEVPAKIQSVSIGIQHQELQDSREYSDAKVDRSTYLAASRFPVYVDLEGSSTGKFLHIAPIKTATKPAAGSGERERIRAVTVRPHSESGATLGEHAPVTGVELRAGPAPLDDTTTHELTHTQIQERRRQTYRMHYPPSKAGLVRSQSLSGLNSFVALKSEMERMKVKLQELEHNARDLDHDFKSSHHKLERLGRTFGDESRPVMDAVDDAIEATSTRDEVSSHSTLSTKAARDMDSARHLLAQIERLTTNDP